MCDDSSLTKSREPDTKTLVAFIRLEDLVLSSVLGDYTFFPATLIQLQCEPAAWRSIWASTADALPCRAVPDCGCTRRMDISGSVSIQEVTNTAWQGLGGHCI